MMKNKDEHQTRDVELQRAGSAFGFSFLSLILRVILRSDIIKQRAAQFGGDSLVRPAVTRKVYIP